MDGWMDGHGVVEEDRKQHVTEQKEGTRESMKHQH